MEEKVNINANENEVGNITISEEVVGVIAGVATSEVKGVASMAGTIVGGIAEILGKKNMGKGVKVVFDVNTVALDLHISVIYGAKVPEIALEIQDKVKKAVESMTGLIVTKVNVYIDGVAMEKESKKETPITKARENAKKAEKTKKPEKKER